MISWLYCYLTIQSGECVSDAPCGLPPGPGTQHIYWWDWLKHLYIIPANIYLLHVPEGDRREHLPQQFIRFHMYREMSGISGFQSSRGFSNKRVERMISWLYCYLIIQSGYAWMMLPAVASGTQHIYCWDWLKRLYIIPANIYLLHVPEGNRREHPPQHLFDFICIGKWVGRSPERQRSIGLRWFSGETTKEFRSENGISVFQSSRWF